MDAMEDFYIKAVRRGEWRIVRSNKRANKLRRRGEDVRWSSYFNGWVWDFWKAHPFSIEG